MNRIPFICVLTFLLLCGSGIVSTTLSPMVAAQDITITIKQSDKKPGQKAPFTGQRPAVDVAVLLDTSNSMDGLISQAKSQLWNIVQEFAQAKKQGQTPILRVSVFEYGNSGLPASEGYIRQVVQLTDDLDKVSEALFGLKTNGGDEYCGMVINEAIKRLDWSNEPNSFKTIFIAGNEPFTQGSVKYQQACRLAIESGIVVNTIHCGNYQQGVSGHWKHGAELAEGEYLNIDQDQKVVHIECPQDEIIIRLNKELNQTYLWYGKKDKRARYDLNQKAQDRNAGSFGSFSDRAKTKSGAMYRNVGRDLVDTLNEDADAFSNIEESELPDSLQAMSAGKRKEHVEKMAGRRAEIKKQMAQINREREAYLKKERAKMPANEKDSTFGAVISKTVRKQLKDSGFETGSR